jgi:peptide/nickel transport system substrate-binding protein
MRWTRAIGVAAVVSTLAACGGGDRTERPTADGAVAGDHETFTGGPPGGTAVVLAEGEPDMLNPLVWESNMAYQVVHLLFRGLGRRDSTLVSYEPDLLERWEQPDERTALLHLRPGIHWHDGRPVTAEDVVFTIERQGAEETASTRAGDVAAVESVRMVDSMTVEVKFSRVGPASLNALLEVVPVPRHLLDTVPAERLRFAAFNERPVGNGLFRFVSWQKGQQVTVEANPDAPEGRPPLDRIVVRVVPEPTARLTELLNGAGDLAKISADQRERVESARGVNVATAAQVRPGWIAFNADRAPVNDARVRRAFLMAVDRNAIVKGLMGPQAEPSLSPIPPALGGQGSEVRAIPHDPAQAGRLLDEAGWRDSNGDGIRDQGGRPLRIEVEYSSADPVRADLLVAMQAQLRRVGIDLVPRGMERTTWVERLRNRQFTASFWGWGWGPGVMGPNAEMVFHSRSIPPNGPNFAGYSNPQADQLIDRILAEADEGRAARLWRQLEQILIDDAVYAPVFLDPEFYAVNDRFGSVRFRGPEWWEDVIYWHVPEDRRLPRDRAR